MKRSRWLGICTVLILVACGGQTPRAEHGGEAVMEPAGASVDRTKPASAASDAKPPKVFDSPPAVGTKVTCPVAGEVFTVAADSVRAEHKGKHVVFCCGGCKPPFTAAPDKFVGK